MVPRAALDDPRLRVQAASAFSRGLGPADCDVLDIRVLPAPPPAPQTPSDGAYRLYVVPVTCARQWDPAPFAAGGPGAWPYRSEWDTVELLVVDVVVVEVFYPADPATLEAVAASLVPVDIASLALAAADAPPEGWTPAELLTHRRP